MFFRLAGPSRLHAIATFSACWTTSGAGGSLPDLIAIAGDPARVVTIADMAAASYGVHLSSGVSDALAVHGLAAAGHSRQSGPALDSCRGDVPLDRLLAFNSPDWQRTRPPVT